MNKVHLQRGQAIAPAIHDISPKLYRSLQCEKKPSNMGTKLIKFVSENKNILQRNKLKTTLNRWIFRRPLFSTVFWSGEEKLTNPNFFLPTFKRVRPPTA